MERQVILFVILAAFFNAVMDRLENETFFDSRFANWKQRFWYKRESWKWAKKIVGYKLDGWHIAKTCMIVSLAIPLSSNLMDFLLIGLAWNTSFNFFYHGFGRKKV